jgi:hypothetical protein
MVAAMRGALAGRTARSGGAVALLACAAFAVPQSEASASTASASDRYSLVHGCFGLRSAANGGFVTKAGEGYDTSAGTTGGAEPFRMQATDLGRYLLYGAAEDFLAVSPTPVLAAVVSADEASREADWTVAPDGDAFTLTNTARDVQLAVDGSGQLVAVGAGTAGDTGRFTFAERDGCATYPEVDLNVTGGPVKGNTPYGEVSGLLEGHMHHMAFEFLGGRAHCGRPWHRFGAPYALRDCPDHEPNGCAAVLENFLWGDPPVRCHDPVGWPTFNDWPHPQSLTHEQSYYKWLERAWRGGLRVFVNLLVENAALCEIYPLKKNSCNEMDSVLLQAKRMQQLQDYIDAQSGGPGEGWFRIVRTPFQAREVINDGKLAVVTGMEVSEPFDCGFKRVGPNEIPNCDEESIDGWLDRLHDEVGVRQLEITNKFDNALTGVAGDNGTLGTVVNGGNFLRTGTFWDLEPCEDPENHDHSPTDTGAPHNDDQILFNGLDELGIVVPDYEDGPLCNQRGFTDLGDHAVRGIMKRGMIFDPDHMSVLGRNQAMDLVEEKQYPGLISSHSWSTPNALPRLYRLGGVITPYAGNSESFYHEWTHLDALRGEFGRQYHGVGYGADMNGFGSQGDPRGAGAPNPVTYPFQSFDGEVTLDRQTSGERTFDINTDGVAHYGLYPDWLQDVRNVAGPDGDRLVADMGRGAEAYLQMWERASGIGRVACNGWETRDFSPEGLGDRILLGESARATLERAGQPEDRTRTWTWCADADDESRKVRAVFDTDASAALIASSVPQHAIGRAGPGDDRSRIPRSARRRGNGLFTARAGDGARYLWVVEDGTIGATGLARRGVSLTEYLALADLP